MITSRPRISDLLETTAHKEPLSNDVKQATGVEKSVKTLGVLLVHGIGDQRRGKTLTQFGEPLFICLQNWLRNHSGGAELRRVMLHDDATGQRTPANAVVHLWHQGGPKEELAGGENLDGSSALTADVKHIETEWLLAESNWADVFARPSFGDVAFWSIRVVPWFILTQFVDQLSDDLSESRLTRALFAFCYLVLTFPLALLIQLLVLLLVPLSLLPPLRPVVGPIQRWISAVIGDTYVLITSRFQFQSMVSTVQEDLEWLAGQCEVVAVLAHSQGAAVAHEALRQARNSKVGLLITFGSAVSRLKALRYVMDHARHMLTASSMITLSALLLTFLYLWSLLGSGGSILSLVFGLWGLSVLLALSVYVMPFSLKGINQLCHKRQDFALIEQTKWEDYYATSDPVPNGRMLSKKEHYASESLEVHNCANILTDHSSYWKNRDQFGIAVLGSLMRLTGGPFETGCDGAPIMPDQTDDLRVRRTKYRVGARVAAIFAVTIAAFRHPALKDWPVPEPLQTPLGWIASFLNWLLSLAADALGLIGSKLNLTSDAFALPSISLPVELIPWPIICVLLVLAWHLGSALILRWWEKADTEISFGLISAPSNEWPRRVWLITFWLLAVAWLGFWIWWALLNPADLWAQIGDKLKPFDRLTRNGSLFWTIALYYLVEAIVKAFRAQHEFSRRIVEKADETVPLVEGYRDIRAAPAGFSPELWEKLTILQARTEPPSSSSFGLNGKDIRSFFLVFHELINDLSKRLGKREVGPRFAAVVALVGGVGSLTIVVFDFDVRGVVQAGLGLISLAFGVVAWVRARGRTTRWAAAFGLSLGVLVMPTASAIGAGLGTLRGLSLLLAGLTSVSCALAGAIFLRQGWDGIENGSALGVDRASETTA